MMNLKTLISRSIIIVASLSLMPRRWWTDGGWTEDFNVPRSKFESLKGLKSLKRSVFRVPRFGCLKISANGGTVLGEQPDIVEDMSALKGSLKGPENRDVEYSI